MNEEEKFLINKLNETAKKLNGNIKISSLEDAASLYAYLKGYSSWNEFLLYEKQNITKFIQEEKIKEKIFKDKHWKFETEFKKSLTQKIHRGNCSFVEKANMLNYFQIGTEELLKTKHPVGLEYKNTLILSSDNITVKNLFVSQFEDLLKWNKSFIILGLDERIDSSILSLLKEKNVNIINQDNIKINPLIDLFQNDLFIDFFSDVNQNNSFVDYWINLIQIYNEQLNYEINSRFLMESIKVENLIQLLSGLEKNISIQLKPLINYINKYLGVELNKESANFILTKEAQEKHYVETYALSKKLNKLNKLYEIGYFDESSNITFSSLKQERKSIVVTNVEDNLKDVFWELIFVSLENSLINEEEHIKRIQVSEQRFAMPIMVWGSQNVINANIVPIFSKHKDLIPTFLYDLNPSSKEEENFVKNEFVKNTEQVLFLKQNLKKCPENLESILKERTTMDYNFFFNRFDVLRDLSENSAILLTRDVNEKQTMKEFNLYVLKDVKLF